MARAQYALGYLYDRGRGVTQDQKQAAQLFTTAAGFAILAVCHLQFMVQASAHSAAPVYLRSAVTALSVLFPNFQLFDFSESIAAGDGIAWFAIGRLTIFTAGYAIFTCSLAGIAFRRREF